MAFKPTQRLNVTRTLSTGERVAAGVLAQNRQGVFGDCLPDGCGLLLQDRVFRQQGIAPTQLTAMDRLATQVGFTDWKQALSYAQESVGVLSTFAVVAQAPRSESQHH